MLQRRLGERRDERGDAGCERGCPNEARRSLELSSANHSPPDHVTSAPTFTCQTPITLHHPIIIILKFCHPQKATRSSPVRAQLTIATSPVQFDNISAKLSQIATQSNFQEASSSIPTLLKQSSASALQMHPINEPGSDFNQPNNDNRSALRPPCSTNQSQVSPPIPRSSFW